MCHKLKIHAQDLLTNAIKNLGIGLYPVQCPIGAGQGETSWKYALPSSKIPSFKALDLHICPGLSRSMRIPICQSKIRMAHTSRRRLQECRGPESDVIRAVQNQQVFIVHISDSINVSNISHNPDGMSVRIPEGYIWASLDCVALDLLCARYCFKTVTMEEGLTIKEKNCWITEFVHHVPFGKSRG